jgi:N-acetylmuramoyl-L-alanine amidase
MNFIKFISLFIFLSKLSFAATILIDPGHGGDDLGAQARGKTGRIYFEKDITLEISQKIYNLLKKKHTVYLTRSIDRTVSLAERAEVAEKIKADLFISIHMNSTTEHLSHGIETYYLDNHKNAAVNKIEKVENAQMPGKSDEDHIVGQILADLVVEKTVVSSKRLAQAVHSSLRQNLVSAYTVHDRGVKAGLFYVLALAKRPAILIECGFISNNPELRRLLNPLFQQHFAKAVASGIEKFVAPAKNQKIQKTKEVPLL